MSRDLGPPAVAIVGMACRFPGAGDVAELWRNLRAGVESVTFFTADELKVAGIAADLLADPRYVRAKAVLAGIEGFDAGFFGYTPSLAQATDPQKRLFLECSWEALEDAGYDPARYRGDIGVYAGAGLSSYLLAYLGERAVWDAVGALQTAIGNRADHLAPTVAYKLDLRGPAVTVQTTCSTSLVAVHLACQSLLDFQCDMALAGGVSIEVPQATGYLAVEGGIGSPDGHCRPFDAAAAGTVGGSGAGVVLLKRLDEALADGDAIRAVILGSAVNNDGAGKIGYTAPSADQQARVIALAQSVAGVEPEEITFVEAHGTGTPLGDPIEVAALTRVFRAKTKRRGFCALGSIKSNFGHLDTAAGIAGLIKTTLALAHRQIPPTLHFARPNPESGLAESPFFVNPTLLDWPGDGGVRKAGVSSFGIGGTNAHAVLAEAPAPPASGPSRPWQLLLLSARTGTALATLTERLGRHLADSPPPLADVAYTLQVGRAALPHRRAVVCPDDPAEAARLLAALDPTRVYGSTREARRQRVVFLFPGQGAQHPGMGRRLYATEPEFRRQVDLCADILTPHLGLDLRRALWEDGGGADRARLDRTALAQPALFVVEHALAKLLLSFGVEPEAMLGHSLGEYVAACLAGVFTLEGALALVAERGRLIDALPEGAMLAVHLPREEVEALLAGLGGEVALAAVNRPSLSVVSGPAAAVDRLEAELAGRGVVCRRLRTSHAFHSPMMEPALAAFGEAVARTARRAPERPYLSNLSGSWIRAEEATDPGYWVRHLRQTVQFAAGAEMALRETEGAFLEVGPGMTLATLVRQHPARQPGRVVLSALRHPRQEDPEDAALLTALGRLWIAGVELDAKGYFAGERRRRVPLPTYPFERRRYWAVPEGRPATPATGASDATGAAAALRGRRADPGDWFYAPAWRRTARAAPAGPRPLPPRRWLVFAGDEPVSRRLSARLAEAGQAVVRVAPGDAFAPSGGDGFALDPRQPGDYAALLAELAAQGALPDRFLHLWTVSPAGADPGDPGQQARQLELGFTSLHLLAQALGRLPRTAPLDLTVVSSNLHEVVGGDLLWPEKAALLGPLRALDKELPGLSCRGLDLDAPAGEHEVEEAVEALLGELLAEGGEPVVAFRGGHRWLPGFAPLPLAPAAAPLPRLRPGGAYLITGGLGGVGLTLAEELARAGARLALLGRGALPPREVWEGWLAAHGADDPTSRRLRRLLAIEALGAEVLLLSADVADPAAVGAAVERARQRFGPLHGVIHAAGVANGGLLQLATPAEAAATLAPKVAGTRALERALAGCELDFFLLCSSRSAFLGRAGGADYAAANAFLDAYSHAGRKLFGPALVSVGWCAWREVGMLAEAARQAAGRSADPVEPAAPAPLPAGEATPHPLLERHQRDDGRDLYWTRASAERLWVANEHRIAGHPVIPGTTYLEMARAAFERRAGAAAVELYDVFFLTPVRLGDDEERLLRLTVEPAGDGLSFALSNHAAPDGSWAETMLGRMRPLQPGPRARLDLSELRQRCGRRRLLARDEDEAFEDLGPRWQNVQQVFIGDGEVLGVVELAPEFAGDLVEHKLHPSLLDRAAGLGEQFLVDLSRDFYLPLSYASLRLHAPLPRRFWSYVRLDDAGFARGETISFDVVLADEDGLALVEIDGYSKKRVNNPAEQLRALATRGAVRPVGAVAAPGGAAGAAPATGQEAAFARVLELAITPGEGQEVLRRLLAHRLPPHVVISPDDLEAAIAEAARATSAHLLEAARELGGPGREEHERPDLSTPYAAPADDFERRLAALWQEVLGVERVGVDDNFFELGGDSVLGIQIVAKAHAAGLALSPGQLFEHQTVARLARALTGGAAAAPPETPAAPAEAPLDPGLLDRIAELAGERPESVARLSPVQQGMLFHSLYAPRSGDYVQQVAFTARGAFDLAAFVRAWERLLARHPILRTGFFWEELDEPLEAVFPAAALPVVAEDWRHLALAAQRAGLDAYLAADGRRGFALSRVPLMRLASFRLGDEEHRILWSYHHLLLDGWSVSLLFAELFALYAGERQGTPPALPAAPPYGDFLAWIERRDRADDEAFWRQALAGFTEPTLLPFDRREREGGRGEAGERAYLPHAAALPRPLSDRLRELARRHHLTLNTLFQGAWALLLARAGGVGPGGDVVFGGVVSGRPPALPGVERILGPFINTLPVRVALPPAARLLPWLAELLAAQAAARGYEHVPLLVAQRASEVPAGRPLFESLVIFENLPEGELERAPLGLELTDAWRSEGRTGYPLALTVFPADEIALQVTADATRLSAVDLRRLLAWLEGLLAEMATAPGCGLADLSGLSRAERHQLLHEWGDTATAVPGELLHQPFEARAAAAGDAVALVLGEAALSFGELDRRANRLAHFLLQRGVGPEERVALLLERSFAMVEGYLAVQKAGGAAVPLPLAAPPLRLGELLDSVRPRLLLTFAGRCPGLPPWDGPVVCLDRDAALFREETAAAPAPRALPDNLAYIVHTSGSTGLPKGIAGHHRGVRSYFTYLQAAWRFAPSDTALQVAALSFDASLRDLMAPLAAGTRVVLVGEERARDPTALLAEIRRQGVTCLPSLVPSLLHELLEAVDGEGSPAPSVRLVLSSGEPLPAATWVRARRAFGPSVQLVNQYGASEGTLTSTFWPLRAADEAAALAPAGRPIANARFLVLSEEPQPLPAGVAGALFLSSAGVARGYWEQPERTAEAFLPDPTSPLPGGRLYRTGDRGRFLADGTLVFLGRLDRQVKVYGHRVEPGEIEAVLGRHPAVREAAVTVAPHAATGSWRLVAWVAGRGAAPPAAQELAAFLRQQLPAYMVPGSFVALDALPRTATGKIDRRSLVPPAEAPAGRPLTPPASAAERALAAIWQEILGLPEVGVEDDFFALGGDSMQAIRLAVRARRFGLDLALPQVFAHPRLADLAAAARPVAASEGGGSAAGPERVAAAADGPVPLVPAQRRLLARGFANPHRYNVARLFEVHLDLDWPRLAAALAALAREHDALGLRFVPTESGFRQEYVGPEGATALSILDLSAVPAERQSATVEALAETLQGTLHLTRGPLLRLAAFPLGGGRPDRLLFTGHHLVLDNVSVSVLTENLERHYEALGSGEPPAPVSPSASFRQWAERLAAYADSAPLEAEAAYWLGLPWERVPRLPRDNPDGDNRALSRRLAAVHLDPEETRALFGELPAALDASVEEILLAAAAWALAEWSGSPVQLFQRVGHGRTSPFPDLEVTRTVGWLAVDHPTVLDLSDAADPAAAVAAVARQLRATPCDGIGHGLLTYLSQSPELTRRFRALPEAEVGFNYRGRQAHRAASQNSALRQAPESPGWVADPTVARPSLLYLSAFVAGERLRLDWTYSEAIHRAATLERVTATCRAALLDLLASR